MIQPLLQTVYVLTSLLLWPVVIVLLFAVAHAVYLFGAWLVEAWQRRHHPQSLGSLEAPPIAMAPRQGIREWRQQREVDPQAGAWLLLDRTEAALARRVDMARTWVRLGPALGLAGTLIPLGPALVALADNDLETLSQNLILAFGTTVLGLLAGGIATVVANAQGRWYRLDLAELRDCLERQA